MAKENWIGKTIGGRYTIDERLGQGGMSAVYRATDPNLRRVVAIKMIHPHLSDNPDFVRRFEEEAAAVAQLRHPNIIQVFDFNHDGDTYYMVLEFVPGETLQQNLRRLNDKGRKMPVGDALNYIAQIGDAVQYAHERGMVHRDIKPANIMLDVYGKAILMDFGIAKIVGGQLHTATGAVVGTAMYMSPEQISGEKVDERSDIYSLGVTMFEALSGRPPFEADSAMTLMMMHINDPIPNIRDLQPTIPPELAAAVETSMRKKRDQRYPTAGQMAATLRRIRDRIEGVSSDATAGGFQPGPGATVVETPSNPDATYVEGSQPVRMTPPPGQNQTVQERRDTGQLRAATPPPPPYRGQAASSTAAGQAPQSTGDSGQAQAYWPGQAQPAGGGVRSTPPPPLQQAPGQPKRGFNLPLLIGGGIGLLGLGTLVLVGLVLLTRNYFFGGSSQTVTPTQQSQVIALTATTDGLASAQLTEEATPAATATQAPTATQASTATPALPTDTPAPVYTATPTVPADRPYVRINNITIQNGLYVVDYETFQYTEQLPGMHVHFFWDTVAPEQAGVPGNGPWILYGGPRPFTKYTVADKPTNATQMCALVANANHSVQAESGTCFDLPE